MSAIPPGMVHAMVIVAIIPAAMAAAKVVDMAEAITARAAMAAPTTVAGTAGDLPVGMAAPTTAAGMAVGIPAGTAVATPAATVVRIPEGTGAAIMGGNSLPPPKDLAERKTPPEVELRWGSCFQADGVPG